MTNDNVQTMIERYRRELIEFNKRNPQKKNGYTQLNDMKSKAVEAVMEEKDELNRYANEEQMNRPWTDEQQMNWQQINGQPMNGKPKNAQQMNGRMNKQPMNGRMNGQMNRQPMTPMRDEPSDYDAAAEYENSKLYIELNAADNNADGSDNNHKNMERIRPERGLTRLETQAVKAMASAVTNNLPSVMQETTLNNPEAAAPESVIFNQATENFPPYSNGGAKTYESLEAFQKANTKTGTLRVQVAAAEQSFPVSNAEVVVTKAFVDGTHEFYRVFTDISGVVFGMTLAAPDRAFSAYPSALAPYATYDITVSHPRYVTVIQKNCAIFDGIETIQFCEMVPKVGEAKQSIEYREQPAIK